MQITGTKNSKLFYHIGDKVKIKVVSVSLDDQSIEYEIVS